MLGLALLSVLVHAGDKDTIQSVLDGGFEENKLPKPTTIVPCIDDDSAHKIVDFIGKFLDKAARGSLSDLISLPQMIKDFGNSLPPEIGQCLDGNAELDALGTKYNPHNKTSDQIEKEVVEYVTLHYLTVHKWLGDLDSLWHKPNPYQTGFNGAKYGHEVLGLSSPESSLLGLGLQRLQQLQLRTRQNLRNNN